MLLLCRSIDTYRWCNAAAEWHKCTVNFIWMKQSWTFFCLCYVCSSLIIETLSSSNRHQTKLEKQWWKNFRMSDLISLSCVIDLELLLVNVGENREEGNVISGLEQIIEKIDKSKTMKVQTNFMSVSWWWRPSRPRYRHYLLFLTRFSFASLYFKNILFFFMHK